jgi:hypothetical protein
VVNDLAHCETASISRGSMAPAASASVPIFSVRALRSGEPDLSALTGYDGLDAADGFVTIDGLAVAPVSFEVSTMASASTWISMRIRWKAYFRPSEALQPVNSSSRPPRIGCADQFDTVSSVPGSGGSMRSSTLWCTSGITREPRVSTLVRDMRNNLVMSVVVVVHVGQSSVMPMMHSGSSSDAGIA